MIKDIRHENRTIDVVLQDGTCVPVIITHKIVDDPLKGNRLTAEQQSQMVDIILAECEKCESLEQLAGAYNRGFQKGLDAILIGEMVKNALKEKK